MPSIFTARPLSILVLILMVAAVDQITVRLRRNPVWLVALLPPAAYALWFYLPQQASFIHAGHTIAGMFPPDSARTLGRGCRILSRDRRDGSVRNRARRRPGAAARSFSARNVAPSACIPVRRFLEALRAIPEVVWGLVLVAVAGVGPVAGILALGFHSGGCLGRLFAESFENARPAPVLAVAVDRGVGARGGELRDGAAGFRTARRSCAVSARMESTASDGCRHDRRRRHRAGFVRCAAAFSSIAR